MSTDESGLSSRLWGLELRNANGLEHYVQDITNPKSVNYHRYLTPAQVTDVLGPDKTSYDALLQFLQQSGFTITATYQHRLLISFSGTVGLLALRHQHYFKGAYL